jgi:hypothetical protein
MHTYLLIEPELHIQILFGTNVIDESGPWESIASATEWAQAYVDFKNSDKIEPVLPQSEQSTIELLPASTVEGLVNGSD